MDAHDMDALDRRDQTRRAEDVRRNATILGLAGLLVAVGIAWGTASAVVQQKLDRSEFAAYRAQAERRAMSDSIERNFMAADLRSVKMTVNETNSRLSHYICDKQPSYCQ